MLQGLQRIAQIGDLRQKILFTLMLLAVCRIGGFVPVPGVNGDLAVNYFRQMTGGSQNLFQLVDVFSGGAFSQMTVIALGVVPYISSSIIMQLLTSLWPSLQREMRENPQLGKKKLNKYTRFLTLMLALFQSLVYAKFAMSINISTPGIVNGELASIHLFGMPILFYTIVMVTMTTGTVFLMWIGEQITERGIGNGMSLIICLGIVSSLPSAIGIVVQQLNLSSQEPGQMNLSMVAVLLALFILVTIGTILMLQGTRKIPLQYARRVVGRKETQGGTSYIPLKINYAGVIPVIFASSLLMFPATIGTFIGQGNWLGIVAGWLSPGSGAHTFLFIALIIFFTYFWTATQFHPDQIASDMKKNGAFIPGVRQGKPTRDFLESGMNRITIIGALFLALIAILPTLIGRFLGLPPTIAYFFGGTSLLILVGVVLDTMKQVESHLLMKRYEGFLKTRRARGR